MSTFQGAENSYKNSIERSYSLEQELTKTPKVLIVEDDEALLASMRDIIGLGHEKDIFSADNAKDGVDLFMKLKESLNLAILDINMPLAKGVSADLSGLDILRFMIAQKPSLRIILSTGYDFQKDVRDLLDEPSVTMLKKPYDAEDLIGAVDKALNFSVEP